jgi:copper chaperone
MLRFHLPTMACGGCAKSVTRALSHSDPKARIEIDLTKCLVLVDTRLPTETVRAVLEQAGFPAVQDLEPAS